MINDLIEIKQLPIIEEQLKKVSVEIDVKVENSKKLICTEENKQAIKKVRTELKKELEEFETRRKAVKEEIMAPYLKFEEIYKENISDKYKEADKALKEKIDSIEDEQKQKLEYEARKYFEEYKNEKNIDFISFERLNLKIGVSDNPAKLKKIIEEFINQRVDDLNLIETQEHKAEIFVEYKESLNITNAITTVAKRFKAIEEEKKKQEKNKNDIKEEKINVEDKEKTNNFFEEAKVMDKNEFIIVPIKKEIILKLHVFDEDIEKIKKFFELSNIEYESEDL